MGKQVKVNHPAWLDSLTTSFFEVLFLIAHGSWSRLRVVLMAACSQVPSAHRACSCDRDECPKNIQMSLECPVHSVSVVEHKGQAGQNPQEGISVWMNCHGEIEFPFFAFLLCCLLVLRVWVFCVNRILRLAVDLQLQLPAGAVAALTLREWFQAYSAPPASRFCSVP